MSTVDKMFFGVFDCGPRPSLEVFGVFGPFTTWACVCVYVRMTGRGLDIHDRRPTRCSNNPGTSPAPQKPLPARITVASPCGNQASALHRTVKADVNTQQHSIAPYSNTHLHYFLGNSCAGAGRHARFFQHLLRHCLPQPQPNCPHPELRPDQTVFFQRVSSLDVSDEPQIF